MLEIFTAMESPQWMLMETHVPWLIRSMLNRMDLDCLFLGSHCPMPLKSIEKTSRLWIVLTSRVQSLPSLLWTRILTKWILLCQRLDPLWSHSLSSWLQAFSNNKFFPKTQSRVPCSLHDLLKIEKRLESLSSVRNRLVSAFERIWSSTRFRNKTLCWSPGWIDTCRFIPSQALPLQASSVQESLQSLLEWGTLTMVLRLHWQTEETLLLSLLRLWPPLLNESISPQTWISCFIFQCA